MPKCRSCDADIQFKRTAKGKMMPCDMGIKKYQLLDKHGEIVSIEGYRPHWETCTDADKHRKLTPRDEVDNDPIPF